MQTYSVSEGSWHILFDPGHGSSQKMGKICLSSLLWAFELSPLLRAQKKHCATFCAPSPLGKGWMRHALLRR